MVLVCCAVLSVVFMFAIISLCVCVRERERERERERDIEREREGEREGERWIILSDCLKLSFEGKLPVCVSFSRCHGFVCSVLL